MRIASFALVLAAIAAPAAALPGDETVTVRIDYADLDLSRAEARATLEQRVEAKIRDACTIETRSRYSRDRSPVDEQCVVEARQSAMTKVDRAIAAISRSAGTIAAN